MLFEFDAEQRLWQDTVHKAVVKEVPPTLVRAVADDGADPTPLWRVYADLGWTELTDPADAVELAIVLEELGRATDPTPYLATLTQFAPLAPGFGAPDQSGTAVHSGVTARPADGGWVLEGTAHHVLDGDRADHLAAVTDAGVFVVPAAEVSAVRTPVFDPALHIAEVTFPQVRVTDSSRTTADPEHARHRALDLVLDHARTRHQFDAPIGSFQAVQHKAADMHVAVERARALAYYAALTIAADDPRRRLAASMAKAAAGECQALVFRNAVQLSGAMGHTWENDLQFAIKRAKAGELMLGGAAEHRALIAELTLAEKRIAEEVA